MRLNPVFWLLLPLLLSACQPGDSLPATTLSSPSLTITNVTQAIPTQTGTPTKTRLPSPTPSPTFTRAPTSTLTPILPTTTKTPPNFNFVPVAAYIDNKYNLYYWEQGSEPILLVDTGDVGKVEYGPNPPIISSDGEWIAFTRHRTMKHEEFIEQEFVSLWVVRRDGTDEHLLVDGTDFINRTRLSGFEWIPGTHKILFHTGYPGYTELGWQPNSDLYIVDVTSDRITCLFEHGAGDIYPSPDGQWLAVSNPERIFIISADGERFIQVLYYEFVYTYTELRYYPPIVWRPDSKAIAFYIPPKDYMWNPTSSNYWIYNLITADRKNYDINPIHWDYDTEIGVSPDLMTIIYSQLEGKDKVNLVLHNLVTGDMVTIDTIPNPKSTTPFHYIFGAFNPSGTRFFTSNPCLFWSKSMGVEKSDYCRGLIWLDDELLLSIPSMCFRSVEGKPLGCMRPFPSNAFDYVFLPKDKDN